MTSPLLTISVPTYNRAECLDRCLDSICSQLHVNSREVEVIVSNNGSTDDSKAVVEKYRTKYGISFYNNSENVGFDKNYIQCVTNSHGKYVWVLGDDDFILPGALEQILVLLRSSDYGVIHLNTISFRSIQDVNVAEINSLEYDVYNDSMKFFDLISYFTTFISGNIFYNSLINKNVNIYVEDSNIVQLYWVLPALFANRINIMINTKTIATQADNSGGYKFIETFSKKYNAVLRSLVDKGLNKKIIPISNKKMINGFFPYYVCKILYEDNSFNKENGFKSLLNTYWKYPDFWRVIVPLYGNFYFKKALGKLG